MATTAAGKKGGHKRIADDALADVFGIEMSEDVTSSKAKRSRRRKQSAPKSKRSSSVTVKRTAKPRAKTGKSKTQVRKNPTSKKVGAKDALRAALNARPITGKAVATLREKFGMSQSQFAILLDVSTPSIGNWEKKIGALNLQTRTLDAWNTAKGLTKRQAWQKLNG